MAIYRGTGGAGDSTTDATVTEVTQQAVNAAASAASASSSATSAATSATNAATSETNAATSASSASTSATNAATSASEASTSATNAATSETNAATSESNASTSETNAATSASNAATSEANAATSATSASTSATNAATSETNAATSASNASTSETNASTSATAAQTAQTAAETAQAAAEAAQEAIDGLYLGAQASDPTLDNNGDPITSGDWYYNTTTGVTRIYDGSAWNNGAVSTAGFMLAANNLSDLTNAATARTNLGLGTAATTASTDYATAAQGALADSALQSFTETNDLSVAVTWANVPDANITQTSVTQHQAALSISNTQVTGLGTAATTASTDYATAAQGALADTATQPGDLGTAAALDVGTGANNVVQLDGTGALPAVDGSNLTNVSSVANLNDLTDVDTTGVADGETIVYNSGTSSWEPGESGGNTTTLGLFEHAKSISTNYSITSGNNALAAGPVDIASGVTVTIPTGSRWAIV